MVMTLNSVKWNLDQSVPEATEGHSVFIQLPHYFSQQVRQEGVSEGGMQPIYLASTGSSPFFTTAGLRTESTVIYVQNKGREI